MLFKQMKNKWAGAEAQLVIRLPCTLVWSPEPTLNMAGTVECIYNPSAEEGETGKSSRFTGQAALHMWQVPGKWETCLQGSMEGTWRTASELHRNMWQAHLHAHEDTCTHVHTHIQRDRERQKQTETGGQADRETERGHFRRMTAQ